MNIDFCEAVYALYPEAVRNTEHVFYNLDGEEISYDLEAVETKMIDTQVKKEAAKQTQIEAKQTALNKLMALGLTEEEALALGK